MGWKPLYGTQPEYVEREVMRMRHAKSSQMAAKGDPVSGRTVLYGNADVEMAVCVPAEGMDYHFKNAQGDECLFIHWLRLVAHLRHLKFGPRTTSSSPKGPSTGWSSTSRRTASQSLASW